MARRAFCLLRSRLDQFKRPSRQNAASAHRGMIVGRSFPLDGGRRLAADVIGDARDVLQLVDDAVGDLLQQLIRQVRPAGRHEVDGLDGTNGDDPLVTTAIADDADGLDWQEDGERLAGLVVPAEVVQFFDEDGVGFTQDIRVFLLHFTEDAHAQTR